MIMFKLQQVASVAAAVAGLAFGIAPATAAPTIYFGTPVVGATTVGVDVVVGNLGNEIVSAYDLDVTYDVGALTFANLTFSLNLGDSSLFEALEGVVDTAGLVDFFSVSLLSDDDLFALQGGGPVTLATIEFTGSDASSLAFANWGDFNDVKGRRNQVIIPGNVPEPATYALIALGLVGSMVPGAVRRRRETHL
jgi:uncharacterized protein (DUF433 family)